ncbi:GDT1-like protein 4 isoform X2 [Primulina eburnea]|uniref:GDT1-like protein 4 isoform X2 n=1 Tax=Primulina eburnea TaxID=1245227 RepID=UPI003C6BEDFA
MGSSIVQGFTKSLAMTVLSEIGDKTFFAAAILAMRHPRRLVLSGCLGALIVMTVLSAVVGWAAPNLISRKWTHHITTLLFLGFGLWSLWDAFNEGETEEFDEVEKELNANFKINGGATKEHDKDADDLKKQNRPFLTQFLSPILLKAFSITFFGEWGDKSQRTSFVYHCCSLRREESGYSNIRENNRTLWWSSFHRFWNPIFSFDC